MPKEHVPKIVAFTKQLRNIRQNQKGHRSKKISRNGVLFRMPSKSYKGT